MAKPVAQTQQPIEAAVTAMNGLNLTTGRMVRGLARAGFTVREIATALSISTQAVYKHLKRGEKR